MDVRLDMLILKNPIGPGYIWLNKPVPTNKEKANINC